MTAECLSLKGKLDELHGLVYIAYTRRAFSLINEICGEVSGLEARIEAEKARADRAEAENKRLKEACRAIRPNNAECGLPRPVG